MPITPSLWHHSKCLPNLQNTCFNDVSLNLANAEIPHTNLDGMKINAALTTDMLEARERTASRKRMFVTLPGKPVHSQRKLIEKIQQSDDPVLRMGLKRFPAKWLRELQEIDAEALFAATSLPMLLIGGEKDLQCDPDDIFRIAEIAQGPSTTVLIENMTHLLRLDDEPASILVYKRLLNLPVAQAVIDSVAQWIHDNANTG